MKKGGCFSALVMVVVMLIGMLSCVSKGAEGINLVIKETSLSKIHGIFGKITISPDSKRFAYGAVRGGKQFVVLDGLEGKEYDGFLRGSRLVFDSPNKLHALAARGTEIFLVEVEIP
ncbi:MAG: hypothetical protein NC833_03995 [Candidatus Omnitrophica bacterium]|nr:hypothetical protein [Candidatus Omnitrophota bacterium]MCM8804399.1 hypothetical protein [Candidatus Omnitrophota bacterium]